MAETYRIRVGGRLDDRWAERLGGLDLRRRGDGTTVLVGPIPDQAALHGVIGRIRDLGLPLLSVNLVNRTKRTSRTNRVEEGNRVDCARTRNEQFARIGGE